METSFKLLWKAAPWTFHGLCSADRVTPSRGHPAKAGGQSQDPARAQETQPPPAAVAGSKLPPICFSDHRKPCATPRGAGPAPSPGTALLPAWRTLPSWSAQGRSRPWKREHRIQRLRFRACRQKKGARRRDARSHGTACSHEHRVRAPRGSTPGPASSRPAA